MPTCSYMCSRPMIPVVSDLSSLFPYDVNKCLQAIDSSMDSSLFLQCFNHILFPKNLQYTSCCETGCCTAHKLRTSQTFLQEFPIDNMFREKTSNFLPVAKMPIPSNYLYSTYLAKSHPIHIQIRKIL